mmetsp:Transcript_72687/g.151736  ORF Transcript_72687/g.151736 Transcript_72687/m.151736 type:complete len:263 (+) Transcript_72687:408-1196(+)
MEKFLYGYRLCCKRCAELSSAVVEQPLHPSLHLLEPRLQPRGSLDQVGALVEEGVLPNICMGQSLLFRGVGQKGHKVSCHTLGYFLYSGLQQLPLVIHATIVRRAWFTVILLKLLVSSLGIWRDALPEATCQQHPQEDAIGIDICLVAVGHGLSDLGRDKAGCAGWEGEALACRSDAYAAEAKVGQLRAIAVADHDIRRLEIPKQQFHLEVEVGQAREDLSGPLPSQLRRRVVAPLLFCLHPGEFDVVLEVSPLAELHDQCP